MTRIFVTITTRDRPQMIRHLLGQLWEQGEGFDLIVWPYYDGKGSKERFWELIDLIFKDTRKKQFDYWIHIPDDVELVPDFFARAIQAWDAVKRADPKAVCLNPLKIGRKWTMQWVNVEPVCLRHGMWRIGWNDCCWVTGRELGDALRWRVDRVIPVPHRLSSGVGSQISHRLHSDGWTVYGVDETLLTHGDHPSVMHPEERERNPLTTL